MGPGFNVFTCNQCLCPGYRFEPTLTQTTRLIKTPNAKFPSGTERNWKRTRDTVREIKTMMMMMTSCLNDSFNPFPLFLIIHLHFVYFICLCFWCFCASWLFVWNGLVWLWERAAVVASLLCSMAATWLTDDLVSHDQKKKHTLWWSFPSSVFWGACTHIHWCQKVWNHIENVIFFIITRNNLNIV